MTHLTVMATRTMGAVLEPYHINPTQIMAMRDMGSHRVRIKLDHIEIIQTPMTEILLSGLSLYASGLAAELLTRTR